MVDTITCPDDKTLCNVTLEFKDDTEECVEYEHCLSWPCNVTGCEKIFVPLPGWCHIAICWSKWEPIPPPPGPPSPWSPSTIVAIVFGILAIIGFLGTLTTAVIYRKSPFMVSSLNCMKKCGIKIKDGAEWFGLFLWVILLICILPFAFIFMILRDWIIDMYGRIRYRDEPERQNHFELAEIRRELDARGCLPPYGLCEANPHRPLNEDTTEEHNERNQRTPILRPPGSSGHSNPGHSGTSGFSGHQEPCQPGSSGSTEHSGTSKDSKGKAKGKAKKKIIPFMPNDVRIHCEDEEGNFKVPHVANNSAFTTVELGDNEEETGLVNPNADGFIEDEYVPQN